MMDKTSAMANVREADVAATDSTSTILDLRGILSIMGRRKGLIATVTVLGFVLTLLIVNRITPQYTANAAVIIESAGADYVDFAAVMGDIASNNTAVASQVEILQSRSLVGRIVDELDLVNDPEFNPYLSEDGDGSMLSSILGLLPESWLAVLGRNEDAFVYTPEAQAQRQRAAVIEAFLARLTIEPVKSTYVIELGVTSTDPRKAARLANATANTYILDQLEAKFDATKQANDWLSTRLEDLRQQVLAADAAVTAYRVEAGLGSDDASQSLVEQQLRQDNAQLTQARSDVAAAQARYDQVRGQVQQSGYDTVAEVLASPLIQSLREREAEAKRKLAELSTKYGDLHPEIINAKAEIEDLQATIRGEVDKIIQNLANEVAVARARQSSIQQTVNELSARFDSERSASVQLRELEREAEATRQLYDTMLTRYKETTEQQDIQKPDVRIISQAEIPTEPSYPRKSLIMPVVLVLFLAVGIGLAFLLEVLNSGFRNLDHVTRLTGITGLVELPLMRRSSRKTPHEEVVKNPTSAFAEAVRSIQTALVLSNVDAPPKVVCLVSSVPNEGKSVLSVSLARISAASGRKILLIDGDLRRPQHHRVVGAKRSPGLTDVMSGSHTVQDVIRVDEVTGLHILPGGTEVPNPHDLLRSKRLRDLVAKLSEDYEMIIVDTPAILAVADGRLVANFADATLMVVRWESTPREVVMTAVRSLRAANAQIVGVVLDQVDVSKQSKYGYSAYGYYYGRYKSYYSK